MSILTQLNQLSRLCTGRSESKLSVETFSWIWWSRCDFYFDKHKKDIGYQTPVMLLDVNLGSNQVKCFFDLLTNMSYKNFIGTLVGM